MLICFQINLFHYKKLSLSKNLLHANRVNASTQLGISKNMKTTIKNIIGEKLINININTICYYMSNVNKSMQMVKKTEVGQLL